MAKNVSPLLYKMARKSRDLEVLLSGNPKRIVRRAKNKYLGRRMGKLWRWP